jgi:hypothetical protein
LAAILSLGGFGLMLHVLENGIAIIRVYLLLFTDARHTSTVSLELGLRERIVILMLSTLVLLGGIVPQPSVSSRRRAADAILTSSPPLPGHRPPRVFRRRDKLMPWHVRSARRGQRIAS